MEGYGIALTGAHQKWNARAIARAALHTHGMQLGYESVADGLSNVKWPGRFERLDSKEVEVILDVAHNSQAAKVLKEPSSTKKMSPVETEISQVAKSALAPSADKQGTDSDESE